MGNVGIVIKIMPEGVDTDMEKLSEDVKISLPKFAKLASVDIVPIAFGLKSLKVQVIVDDKKGGLDAIEEAFGKLPGVESVETESVGLID